MYLSIYVDPFDQYTDSEIWDVLSHVNMKLKIEGLEKKLDELVADGGENFSAGKDVYLFIYLSIYLFISLSIYLSISIYKVKDN
jgi:ABC-type multidrug transport system fused ATPase/permease subunit